MSDHTMTMLVTALVTIASAIAQYLGLAGKIADIAKRQTAVEVKCAVCEQRLTALETGTIAR